MTKDGPKQKPKPFSSFRYPRWLVNVIMLLILVSFIAQLLDGSESTTYISLALQNISLYLIAIQGTAVLDYILKRNSVFILCTITSYSTDVDNSTVCRYNTINDRYDGCYYRHPKNICKYER